MKNFLHGDPWKPILLNTSALARLLCPLFRLETTMSMHCIRIGIFVQPKHHKVMNFYEENQEDVRRTAGGQREDTLL